MPNSDNAKEPLKLIKRVYNGESLSVEEQNILKNLTELKYSDKSGNFFPFNEQVVSALANLCALDLRKTTIPSLETFSSLKNLRRLYISEASLESIPKWLVDKAFRERDNSFKFRVDDDYGNDSGVYMKGVKLSQQPVSLFKRDIGDVKKCYEEEAFSINEAKVVFLGDSQVGKTETIRKITGIGSESVDKKAAPYADIYPYARDSKPTIKFWDFIGVKSTSETTCCHLTDRACYVIVVRTISGTTLEQQARRWLHMIERFAPDSTVILAWNQKEDKSEDLDPALSLPIEFNGLKRQNPDAIKYVATETESVAKLKDCIEKVAYTLPSANMSLPKSWWDAGRNYLTVSSMAQSPKSYKTKEEYLKDCEKSGLHREESHWLLEWFHDLDYCRYYQNNADGVCLSRLPDHIFPEVKWLSDAVDFVVCNSKNWTQRGCIKRSVLFSIWNAKRKKCGLSDSNEAKIEFNCILEFMRKFHISIEYDDDFEFIPALCCEEAVISKDKKRIIRCEVRYVTRRSTDGKDFHKEPKKKCFPEFVLHRLTVACLGKINCFQYKKRFYVDEYEAFHLYAVCSMEKGDNKLCIDVYQENNRINCCSKLLLDMLLGKLNKINDDLQLNGEAYILSSDGKEWLWSSLMKAWNDGKKTVWDSSGKDKYEITELLGPMGNETDLSKLTPKQKEKQRAMSNQDKSAKIYNRNVFKEGSSAHFNGRDDNSVHNRNGRVNYRHRDHDNVKYEDSPLVKELGLFKKDLLKQLTELNDTQKEYLSEAIDYMAQLDETGKIKKENKNNFLTVLKLIGVAIEKVLTIASAYVTLRPYFPLLPAPVPV